MRKLTYAIACSIDGFIGDQDGDASFMYPFVVGDFAEYLNSEHPDINPSHVRRLIGTDGVPNKKYDTVVQGRASYDVALKEGITSPYAHLREYVASRTLKESPDPNVEIISDDLVGKVRELKAEDGELGIYLCGGSAVAGALIDEIDELIIKTYPVVQGSGMPMFGSGFAVCEFTLDEVRSFDNGVLVRTYSRKR
ncbi:dihydrofolate reductase family protein [Streptomyces europaeiscabiei]|uniref:dihydrofolate reductase family protein n=1 Tax=Streptomyces europaeiscabiei TaxID=146819 RepID=UPI0029AA5EF9|nr:dihydrofolate reductase family protein [Streptomyces europaeiscabiei]MDX2759611.1 dihydrofolate reductase family protein [Streptomyces europaeiscabiei]MDX2775247.1 dihydrofolate reductase family protein [Streptomyces europaeiscabiei]MDX3667967.1 dihydrofolate reductase family protein [Streptomyces europaeiscabiei]MDX3777364.1 dihydrofolate reductase family protein [Streptomyces europaeiscabiei]MDX3834202.1 dihydrofolate reductase family protein [Streptomyces europaeiscabiei]